ncbi:MAG: 30S ribosomal protein S3 [Bacilli bacterium]|jgi:small subunit ribosomal protein S3|nr:30S ribosomal protein S3 [Bacilli bacterium]MDD3422170.1 30S ribosomal protein S3 [Bacilli bacterium]MDD4065878.1 30S ribosomal protein S3 [Bacilli bacterium]
MGQKVNPVGMRIGINRDWDAKWYADKEYGEYLQEDIKIRKLLEAKLKDAALARTEILRTKDNVEIIAHVARPGVVIGQDGKTVEELNKAIAKISKGKKVKITVVEVKQPNLDATLVAKNMAQQLEQRASFRTVQKKAIQLVMKSGAKGIKTLISGRLAGADIARSEGYSEGIVPLHTLRADIDFAVEEAQTTYGKLGVKVWICRGEILDDKTKISPKPNEAKGA